VTAHEKYADDLPLYALGALPDDAAEAVETHVAECAACRRELQQLEGDLALLALAVPQVEPPQGARALFLQSVAREGRELPDRRNRWILIPVMISVGLALFAVMLWRDNYNLRHQVQRQQEEAADQQRAVTLARHVLETLTAPDAVRMTLVAARQKPQPQGHAVYVPRNGWLVFLASNLNLPPPGKTYQLWLMSTSSTPMPAGTFKPDPTGSAAVMMPPIPKGTEPRAFCVTVEPGDGSVKPTMPLVMASAAE
jgi:anti-sigma-K factor RskA